MSLWDKQPCDSEEGFLAFVRYRDSTPPRAVRRTRGGSTEENVARWYRECNWHARAVAYDAYLDEMVRSEREGVLREKAQEATVRHLSLIQDMQFFAAKELQKYITASQESEAYGLMKPGDMIKMIEKSIVLYQLLKGLPTEIQENRGQDLSALSIEQLKQLSEIAKKLETK